MCSAVPGKEELQWPVLCRSVDYIQTEAATFDWEVQENTPGLLGGEQARNQNLLHCTYLWRTA